MDVMEAIRKRLVHVIGTANIADALGYKEINEFRRPNMYIDRNIYITGIRESSGEQAQNNQLYYSQRETHQVTVDFYWGAFDNTGMGWAELEAKNIALAKAMKESKILTGGIVDGTEANDISPEIYFDQSYVTELHELFVSPDVNFPRGHSLTVFLSRTASYVRGDRTISEFASTKAFQQSAINMTALGGTDWRAFGYSLRIPIVNKSLPKGIIEHQINYNEVLAPVDSYPLNNVGAAVQWNDGEEVETGNINCCYFWQAVFDDDGIIKPGFECTFTAALPVNETFRVRVFCGTGYSKLRVRVWISGANNVAEEHILDDPPSPDYVITVVATLRSAAHKLKIMIYDMDDQNIAYGLAWIKGIAIEPYGRSEYSLWFGLDQGDSNRAIYSVINRDKFNHHERK